MDITTISTLAAHLAAKHDLNPKDAKNIVTDVFAEIVNSAKRGEIVAIQNFGKFTVKDRKAHQGRNPATGEPLSYPASRKLAYSASKAVKDALNSE